MTVKRRIQDFRWDLFLRDYKAYLRKDNRTLEELSYDWGVISPVLSGLKTGRLTHVGIAVLERILKGMNLYYEFYQDKDLISESS